FRAACQAHFFARSPYTGGTTANIVKTLLFTVFVPGTVAGYLPYALYARAQRADFGSLQYAGWLVIAIGMLMYLWCAWDFATVGRGTPLPADPPKELVV